MSKIYFNDIQNKFDEPIEQLEDIIQHNKHGYRNETIDMFIDTLTYLKLSKIFLRRVDCLLSGDDSEDSFREKLNKELHQIKSNFD